MPETSPSSPDRPPPSGRPAAVTLGLSLHRPELLPLIAAQMERHAAVVLEEPPEPGFGRMLSGALAIEDYLLPLDLEYPAFSRGLCGLLRRLHARGKAIYQIEPYLQSLIAVHELFARGLRPEALAPDRLEHTVYRAERAATAGLLAFYQSAAGGAFAEALAAAIRFARIDAARFRLRDSLRAQAIADVAPRHASCYVEAGLMHYGLLGRLRRELPAPVRVRPVFVADAAVRSLGYAGRLYGPGDRLTLLYIFRPAAALPRRERLLAARALVHAKILEKAELSAGAESFPHLQDEIACLRAVDRLSFEDCAALFPEIRRRSSAEARAIVFEALARPGSDPRPGPAGPLPEDP